MFYSNYPGEAGSRTPTKAPKKWLPFQWFKVLKGHILTYVFLCFCFLMWTFKFFSLKKTWDSTHQSNLQKHKNMWDDKIHWPVIWDKALCWAFCLQRNCQSTSGLYPAQQTLFLLNFSITSFWFKILCNPCLPWKLVYKTFSLWSCLYLTVSISSNLKSPLVGLLTWERFTFLL